MITVHHLNNSRSQRVLWLLEELGVPYEIKHYQRDPQTMLAPESLRCGSGLPDAMSLAQFARCLCERCKLGLRYRV